VILVVRGSHILTQDYLIKTKTVKITPKRTVIVPISIYLVSLSIKKPPPYHLENPWSLLKQYHTCWRIEVDDFSSDYKFSSLRRKYLSPFRVICEKMGVIFIFFFLRLVL